MFDLYSINMTVTYTPLLFLLLGAGMVAGQGLGWHKFEPNCTTCPYYHGIGYVKDPDNCNIYFVCYRNPYGYDGKYTYKWKLMCCAEGLSWDEYHLTCVWDHECNDSREYCPPPVTTTDRPCPEEPVPGYPTKFRNKVTWQVRMCPYGQIWNQEECTCVVGGDYKDKDKCHKLLHFDFNGTYDSDVCYNFAKGEPYGNPRLTNGSLCLNGRNQFLSIPFLNNWFTWNPKAKTFTMCVWIFPRNVTGKYGIFSTNCYFNNKDSALEIFVEDGHLVVVIPGHRVKDTTYPIPAYEWTKICVTFNHGVYKAYLNGNLIYTKELDGDWDVYSHSAATLGFVDKPTYSLYHGYMDDFCFWHVVLTDEEIYDCYTDGPSTSVPYTTLVPYG